MKQGSSLVDMAVELERQLASRKDYVAPQSLMRAVVEETGDVKIEGVNGAPLPITDFAHGQIAGQLEIPKKYYDRMKAEEPHLLARNVNVWLQKDGKSRRMVRTLDGSVRAFLSDKYRPLDNYDLLTTTLPVFKDRRATIVSNEVTEKRLYLKAILPELCEEIEEGLFLGQGHDALKKDTIVAAVTISNSEIGAGGVRIDAGFYKTRCTNLAIFSEGTMKKYHVGRSAGGSLDDAVEYFTDETRQADDKAFWMKVRDVVSGAFDADLFKAQINKMRIATADPIKSADLPRVVEVTRKIYNLPEGVQNGIVTHLIRDMDLTRWGLLNAVTRTAEDVKSYDDATELERVGGKILDIPTSDWREISEAA